MQEDPLFRRRGNVCVGRFRVNYWLRVQVKAADRARGRRNHLVNTHLQNLPTDGGDKIVGDQSEHGREERK